MQEALDYTSIFNILPEQYVVFDIRNNSFTMVGASDKYLVVTGKTRSEVIGKELFDVFPDTSEKALKTGAGDLRTSLETVLATNESDSTGVIRYDIADENGSMQVRYWQATHFPIIKNKKCIGIVQSTTDVTDLIKSKEQLKLANLKLEEAMVTGLIGSWSWDIQNDVVTADKGLANLFGVSQSEALEGLPLETFVNSIYEEDRARVSELIAATLKKGKEFESEYRTIDKEGNIRWVIARGQVERDARNVPIHFPGVMIDISSRKHAEEKLKDSEERLRFMADTMPQLVWITRPDGYHEYYNRHWYEFTGTQEGETDGARWNNLFHKDDQDMARKVWQKSLKTGEPYEIKYRLYHAGSSSYRWVIGRALPYKNDKGDIVKWYGTCTDIDDSIKEIEKRKKLEEQLQVEKERLESRVAERTSQLKLTNEGLREEIKKRQDAEQQLRHYSDELKRSNKELEEFAYVSSHDLQEPLRKIQAFGDLLVNEYAEELGDGNEYLTRIQSSASRMSKLIEDLLAFSRVTTKQSVSSKVDLNGILADTISDIDERIKREHGKVVVVSKLPVVCADETHMRQLFQNLISNALKFHAKDRDPVIKIEYTSDDEYHKISVIDNGIGIDEKYVQKIFAVFQRLHAKNAFEGTGIGLAVCKKIVQRYNGSIDVISKLNVGTTFTVNLPIEE